MCAVIGTLITSAQLTKTLCVGGKHCHCGINTYKAEMADFIHIKRGNKV